MLDIRFIRENPELVAEKSKQKGYEVDIPKLLELDEQRRQLISDIEVIRAERNENSAQTMRDLKTPKDEFIERGKHLKDHLTDCEARLKPIEEEYEKLLKAVPNMPADDVPVGASEAENAIVKEWGEKPHFDFEPKTHWQIAENRGLIDKERAAKVAGSRFSYIRGDLVKLQFALIQFVINALTDKQIIDKIIKNAELDGLSTEPFTPILPPAMIRTEVYDAMDRLEPRDDRYKVGSDEDNLWLQGSAEHTLGPMYKDEVILNAYLPIRYIGYLTSFRREAGTYGKDMEGIIRLHQFDKLEMESFTNNENGLREHLFLVAIQEYLVQQLGLPYRVLQKCTADIGKPNARGIDVEAWLPGQGKYLETHTADYMTDYQTRRLKTRVKFLPKEAERNLVEKGESGMYNAEDIKIEFAHTNDATAFAMGRTMVAIIENYQTAEGKIKVPEVLQTYMGGQDII